MKMKIRLIILIYLAFSVSCGRETLSAKTVGEIKTPRGYSRPSCSESSYSLWIRNLPLKSSGRIKRYDGKYIARNYYSILSVINLPLLYKTDIEQCADWAFRFWSEYHRDSGKLQSLYLFNYSGRKQYYRHSRKNFRNFLRWSMAYSNSYSIKKGCRPVNHENLRPGDMLVQNTTGGIGHVSIIMDLCINRKGEKLYLIGYSFMPAQEFHIERASGRNGKQGWFTLEGYGQYLKEHLDFGEYVIRRFD